MKGIVIRNETEQLFLDIVKDCHSFLNAKLNLSTRLNVERHLVWGNDTIYAGYYCGSKDLVNLNFERMYGFPLKDILKVLCHEIRHAHQTSMGWLNNPLSTDYRRVSYSSRGRIESDYWKGKRMERTAYKDCPWEIDARNYEDKYFKLLAQAKLVTSKQSTMAMPGNKHSVRDNTKYNKIFGKREKQDSIKLFVAYVLSQKERMKKDKQTKKKYTPLFKKYGVMPEEDGSWKATKSMDDETAKRFDKLWKQYKKAIKHEVRKDGEIMVGLKELPGSFRSWNKKAYECYWENEAKFEKNFIKYPMKKLTFRDLTC